MASQPVPHLGQREAVGEVDLDGRLQKFGEFASGGFLLDLGVEASASHEAECGFLGIDGAEDEGENPGVLLLADRIEVGEAKLARLHLLLDLGGAGIATQWSQRIAGDQREAGVAVGGLLTGLDDDARRFEFDEGVVGVALVHRNVDEQAGRVLVVQEGVDLTAKLEERAVETGYGRAWQGEIGYDSPVVLLGVVPDDESVVVHLLGDEVDQVFGDDALGHDDEHPRIRLLDQTLLPKLLADG